MNNLIDSQNKYKIMDKNMKYDNKTFSGYKKSSIFNELNNCIIDSRIENVCYWVAEITCSGYNQFLWDKLITIMSKNININNPLLPQYIYEQYIFYNELTKKCNSKNFIELRNLELYRKQICEVSTILALSKKINIPKIPKIYITDFYIENIKDKLQAKNTFHIDKIFKEQDPMELRIPINELIFNIHNKNLNYSLYWLNWILEYDKKISKKEKKLACNIRNISNIEAKYKDDVSWIIWNTLIYCSENNANLEQIKYLYKIYKINFCQSKKTTRSSLFIHAILLLIEKVDNKIPLKNREDIINNSINNVNVLYHKLQLNKFSEENTNINTSNFENIQSNNIQDKSKFTQEVLKNTKMKEKKNSLNEKSQSKLDAIMNITHNICNI